ncbi:ABC transporter [Enterococcus sp. BWT-B8]|uniref:ABC transporter n=1 Tax=unclassified Enterococcus TaxID=2608891 RepID=UPI001E52E711|nr:MULTISPECIES: ABC transporter [unclassified Enterococcus]MCB5952877.1 ABC transporter [Enterococcus sp. BWT-B8]MCB5953886.1 ABC transporter [Enterococcus sp. CWB-B31]
MNKLQLSELVRTNLRYANPQITDKLRRKGKSGKELTRSLINQYLFSGVAFLFIYGTTMFMLDFSKLPGFFTYYVALFTILAFSQGISVIYNIFFESRDLPAYLPLPFSQGTIFLSKILVVTMTVSPFVFPMFIVFMMTGWRSGIFMPLTILLSLLLFLLILAIVFTFCSLIVFGLTRTSFFKKHKKVVTSLLLGLSMTIAVIGIVWMNMESSSTGIEQMDRNPIIFFMPIFHISATPFSTAGLISFAGLLGLLLVLFEGIKLLILPRLYEQLTEASAAKGNIRRTYKANQSLSQLYISYNLQLLKEPNLIMQVLSNSLLMPIIFIVTFAIGGMLNLSALDIRFIGVVFLAGAAIAAMTVNQTSFISNLISLDQENFTFLQSLPISMHYYMKQKFLVGLIIQSILTGAISLIAGFVFKLPPALIIALLAGALLGCFLFCLRFFSRDYQFLLLDWTSITQLFNRGSGSVGLVVTMLGTIFGSILVLTAYGFATAFLPFWPLNLFVLAVLFLFIFLWIRHYRKKFWHQFK